MTLSVGQTIRVEAEIRRSLLSKLVEYAEAKDKLVSVIQ